MPSSTPRKPLLQLAEKKCSLRAGARARDMRAREVAFRNGPDGGIQHLYVGNNVRPKRLQVKTPTPTELINSKYSYSGIKTQ